MSPVKKPRFVRKIGFTDRERQILEAIAMYHRINSVAKVLRIKSATVRTTLHRIRVRYDISVNFIEEYHKWKKEMPKRKYL
jgi:DNA-binding CsgD family transcriptional regulator